MSDQRPRFFKMAVLDTSLVDAEYLIFFVPVESKVLTLNTHTCSGCKSESPGHIQR